MKTLKYSRQRESIKACLMSRKDHPTADALYTSIREQLTNYLGYEHGFACAALMPAFISKASDADGLAAYADMTALELSDFIENLFKKYIPETDISDDDAKKFSEIGLTMPSLNNHVFEPLDLNECERIYKGI